MRSRAWKALPWAAVLTGTAVAAWALLRLRRACPHGRGKRDPIYGDAPLTPAVQEAVDGAIDRAVRTKVPRPEGGGQRMHAALTLPGERQDRLSQFCPHPLTRLGAAQPGEGDFTFMIGQLRRLVPDDVHDIPQCDVLGGLGRDRQWAIA